MARTRTPGITIDLSGCRTLNKEHRATRIFARLGGVSQEAAEVRLRHPPSDKSVIGPVTRRKTSTHYRAHFVPRVVASLGVSEFSSWRIKMLHVTFCPL
jgi:hypothetical protein